MNKIVWLEDVIDFPDVENSLHYPNGLLAASRTLTPELMLRAYAKGIFPWYSDGEPVLWWSPNPRCILLPDKFIISKSLSKAMRNRGYYLTVDHDPMSVIRACATVNERDKGTWITHDMFMSYKLLFDGSHLHSMEVWQDASLVGGVFGVHIGGVFYAESMFFKARDASKIALAHLCLFAQEIGIVLIDCQFATKHLLSLGAEEVSRRDFILRLSQAIRLNSPLDWTTHFSVRGNQAVSHFK